MSGVSFMALAGATSGIGGNDAFTKILLHMDGSNGGTVFTDNNAGGSAHTWTPSSATTSTTQFKFGSTSLSAGSTGYITTPDSADFTLGSGDWTVDTWFYVSGGSGAARYLAGQMNSAGTNASSSLFLGLTSGNVMSVTVNNGSTPTTVNGTTAYTTTGWHHVAFVRTGNILRLFLDGVQEGGDVAFSLSVNDSANNFSVGRLGEFASNSWNGFIDEFRLSVGVARWTANFTPPVAAYT